MIESCSVVPIKLFSHPTLSVPIRIILYVLCSIYCHPPSHQDVLPLIPPPYRTFCHPPSFSAARSSTHPSPRRVLLCTLLQRPFFHILSQSVSCQPAFQHNTSFQRINKRCSCNPGMFLSRFPCLHTCTVDLVRLQSSGYSQEVLSSS